MPKKVLIISYIYPPAPGGGSPRLVRITRALAEQGFEVLVLTVKSSLFRAKDSSLLSEVENRARIYRTESLDPKRIAYLFARFFSRKKSPQITQPSSTSSPAFFKLLWRIFSRLRNWLLIPDEYIGWLPFAFLRACRIILREKPTLIITSSSPHSVQLAGLALKKIFKIPWLADFRDAWARHPYYFYPTLIHRWLSAQMEKSVVRNADLVLFAYGLEEAKKTYPKLEEKFKPLANAYSEKDFQGQKPHKLAGFSLLYVGAFYGAHSPKYFFQALSELISEHPEIKPEIRVWMIGQFSPELFELVKKYQLEKVIQIKDFLPHQQIISWLCSAKVLLLFLGSEVENSIVIPGKVFEYLRAPSWILAMIPEGETAQILRQAGGVVVVNGTDIKGIKEAILKLYSFYRQGKVPQRNYEFVAQFEEKQFQERLLKNLLNLIKGSTNTNFKPEF